MMALTRKRVKDSHERDPSRRPPRWTCPPPIHRRQLTSRGIPHSIARRGHPHGSGLGEIRYVVERSFAWLHRHRRLATCYERRPDIHDALFGIGCILICWRHLERSFETNS
jgi:hypothetical protein